LKVPKTPVYPAFPAWKESVDAGNGPFPPDGEAFPKGNGAFLLNAHRKEASTVHSPPAWAVPRREQSIPRRFREAMRGECLVKRLARSIPRLPVAFPVGNAP